ncbi:helix-turn-helix domain-containing protein [Prevotella sp. 10(H)]|uniref:helix-turn-helix domain-containing protein n=1 Tax=Prevotella sp. 10(H) TaxID=1158294 RepID=UPI0004A77DD4|nr:helix-turn-helix domain-containing protein [Prevotella sp. 10(H)]
MDLITGELIQALKRNTPEKGNTVDLLMNIIPIGKEAAYRRLRGEIPFTLEEAVTICRKMNISMDLLIGTKNDNTYAFHLSALFAEDPMADYCRMLNEIIDGVEYLRKDPDGFLYRAYKALPQEFLFRYELLGKVYLYILFYQLYPQQVSKKLTNIYIPPEVFTLQKKAIMTIQGMDSVLIFDKHIFADYIEIVKYFQNLELITNEEVSQIKRDLHMMVNDMEKCAISGLSMAGKKLDIYVSHISFDCTYSYLTGFGYESASTGLYCIDFLSSENPVICENHKRWLKSLIRFSTLISVSGELQRNEYFYYQRSIIDLL